jgi:acetyl-CoA synthetase
MSSPYQIQNLQEYHESYKRSVADPSGFWSDIAQHFEWKKSWNAVCDWNFQEPSIRWFDGAELNITENALDRHVRTQPDAIAIIWEPNDPTEDAVRISYRELLQRVEALCHVYTDLGITKGDRVCLYMPMVPELAIAVLACARMGAVHSVVFGGFSPQSIADRINDAECKLIVTADGFQRGPKPLALKSMVDESLELCPSIEHCLVLRRANLDCSMKAGRDIWWHEAMKSVENKGPFPAVSMNAEDMLFILYTSGSTGKPKGVVHTCAGYMVWATYTFVNVFQYQKGQVHFCTADIGWITGHSYIVYGPLCAGATVVLFEGVPNYPKPNRFWEICEKHAVDILYTAPTAIRSLMHEGDDWVAPYALESLKTLGSVGEPINEEAWHWYHEKVGHGRCPLVDTWWQTETGGIMISALAGISEPIPAWATKPLPGVQPILVDEQGNELDGAVSGNLCIKAPWPGMLRSTYGDHERCRQNYFATYPNLYFTGDGAIRDADGNYRITGRVDDVLNVSGHRIGTAEVENAINTHSGVVESAVVGFPHDIKGQGIYAYVITTPGHDDPNALRSDIMQAVNTMIGPFARPDKIQIVPGLPKTRSGKIMRRILRKIAENELDNLGDTSTLLDPTVVSSIIAGREKTF